MHDGDEEFYHEDFRQWVEEFANNLDQGRYVYRKYVSVECIITQEQVAGLDLYNKE